jgi:hypothetical protein
MVHVYILAVVAREPTNCNTYLMGAHHINGEPEEPDTVTVYERPLRTNRFLGFLNSFG